MISFSIVLCTYAKDNALHLAQALESLKVQTVLPNELIIVKDGPLPDSLEKVLAGFSYPCKMTFVELPNNVTLGPARDVGLRACSHEWVALMDSDDVCLPSRFEKQVALIAAAPSLDIVGGQIVEFDDIPGNEVSLRSVPAGHAEIMKFSAKRNPFNAMTVMFRRDLAIAAGGFGYFPGFEDYDLWARMIARGAKCANSPDVLVHARIGNGMYERRKGFVYIRSEVRMQKQLRNLGMTSLPQYISNIVQRVPIRLLPTKALAMIYKLFARTDRRY